MDRQFLNNKNKRKIEPLLCEYIFQESVYILIKSIERSRSRTRSRSGSRERE